MYKVFFYYRILGNRWTTPMMLYPEEEEKKNSFKMTYSVVQLVLHTQTRRHDADNFGV